MSRFLAQQRPPIGQRPSIHRQRPASARPPTPRHVSFLLIRRPDDLTAEERVYIERLCQADAAIGTAYALATDVAAMRRGRQGERLDAWIAAASESAIPDLRRFAAGLGADKKAVQAGLTLPWSNGQTEAHIERLKTLRLFRDSARNKGPLAGQLLADACRVYAVHHSKCSERR